MTFHFSFAAPERMLSSNQRLHWATRSARTVAWRQAAYIHATRAKRGRRTVWPWSRAHITIGIAWPDGRSRDVNNWQPTAKAIVDGIVDAGILPDDNDDHLIGPDLRRRPQASGTLPEIYVVIERLPDAIGGRLDVPGEAG